MIDLLDFQSFLQDNGEAIVRPGFWSNNHLTRLHGAGSIPTNPGR
jgi:hypothetical protein